ncbi:MAG TPA: hypothetical protein VIH95_08815, partial [Acidimicrobiales bacterium]
NDEQGNDRGADEMSVDDGHIGTGGAATEPLDSSAPQDGMAAPDGTGVPATEPVNGTRSAAGADGEGEAIPDADAGVAGEEEAHRAAVDAVDGLLDEVERALARLDDGTYGRCETCGSPIDDTDLAAQPLVRECRSCGTGILVVEGA